MLIIQVLDDRSATTPTNTAHLAIQWRGSTTSAASAHGCVAVHLDSNPELKASLLDVVGQAYLEYGSHAQAIVALEDAVALRKQVFGDSHPTVAESLKHLASAYRHASSFDKAAATLDEVLRMIERFQGKASVEYADAQLERSALQLASNDLDAARKNAQSSFDTFDGKSDVRRVHSLDILARVIDLCSGGDKTKLLEATKLYAQIAKDPLLAADNPWRVHFAHNEATILHRLSDFEGAREKLDGVIAAWQKESGDTRPGLIDAFINRGRALRELGQMSKAKADVEAALNLDREVRGPRHPYVAYDLVCLARLLMEENCNANKDAAQRALDEAIQIYRDSGFAQHAYLEVALRRRYALLQKPEDEHEANAIRAKIAAVCEGSQSAC